MNETKITIELTDGQLAELDQLEAAALEAEKSNAPGMILGQLWGNRIVFFFIPNAQAKQMQLLGIDENVVPGDIRRLGYRDEE